VTLPQDPPVSVKAALRCGDRWVLLRNNRDEWELPGGRVDADDATLQDVVRRECREELGVEVDVGELIAAYLFEVIAGRRVAIVCFAATVSQSEATRLRNSDEHNAVGLFTVDEIGEVAEKVFPAGYRNAIVQAATRLAISD